MGRADARAGGGILGRLLAVEGTKRALGVRRRTGGVYVFPLVAGMAIGRVGCFLSGWRRSGRRRQRGDSIGGGILLGLLSHGPGIPALALVLTVVPRRDELITLVPVFLFGWTQALYMPVPIVVLIATKRWAALKGLLILVGVGFPITSGCVGLVRFA